MVRVLHFADLHLGMENYGRPDPATGLHTRVADFCRSLDEMVEYALHESVDLVLFAGDAYKSRDPSPTHQREFARRIHRLATNGIPVFLLTGNHDLPNAFGRADTLDIFQTLQVPNVHVARKPEVLQIATRRGPIQIVALPWIAGSHLLSREEYKNVALTDLETLVCEKLENIVQALLQQLDTTVPTILTAHGSVLGVKAGSERRIMLGQDLVLPPSLLSPPSIDYVALGHVHCYQVLQENPPLVYCGSIDRIDFGEEKEDKGFVVAEVERGHATFQFHTISCTRRFVTIEVLAYDDDPMAAVRAAIAARDVHDAIVRIVIHTTMEKNHLLRDQEIHALLDQAFKVAAVIRDVERPARLRLGSEQGIEQMTPLQALEKYLQVQQVPPEHAEKLLQYAGKVVHYGVQDEIG